MNKTVRLLLHLQTARLAYTYTLLKHLMKKEHVFIYNIILYIQLNGLTVRSQSKPSSFQLCEVLD